MKDRIRQLMEDQHLTQQNFAQMIGISTATLSNIFNGKTNPSLSIVDGIHKSFPQVNVYWVLYGTPPMYQNQASQGGSEEGAADMHQGITDGAAGGAEGYDIKAEKVAKLAKSTMKDNRPVSKALEQGLKLTNNIDDLKKCNVYIIAVPTPVNKSNKPDISCVRNATAEVGKILKEGDIVVYESTVYPGLTEEVCAPLLASTSGLKLNQSFFVGFSPERINPGDTVHTIENIVKVTSGSTPEAAAIIDSLYASVLTHGTYRAKSIKIAEACKLMENCQRDVQIAFFNEMEKIFDKMNINIEDVTAAASTKWNFVPATPGLVGGHCIAVDPYYLINKAQEVDVVPSLLSTAREVNEQMAVWMAGKIKNASESRKFKAPETNVLILGFSFKPDSDDIRNTKVADLYINLVGAGYKTTLYDPLVDVKEVKEEYNIKVTDDPKVLEKEYQIVVIGTHHKMFDNINMNNLITDKGFICDIYGIHKPRN